MSYEIRNIIYLGFSIILFSLAITLLPLLAGLMLKALGKALIIVVIVSLNLLWVSAFFYQIKVERKKIRRHEAEE